MSPFNFLSFFLLDEVQKKKSYIEMLYFVLSFDLLYEVYEACWEFFFFFFLKV